MAKTRSVKAVKQGGRKGRKSQAPTPARWWEQAEEVPRAGLPDAERINKASKRWRWFVRVNLVLMPLMALTVIVAISRMFAPDVDVEPAQASPYAQTKSDAVVAVRKWIAQTPSPLPGAVLVGWDSATTEEYRSDPEDPNYSENDNYDIEVHHLTLASPSGLLYDTTVALAVNKVIGAVVVGEPTLIPRAPSAGGFNAGAWVGYETTRTSDAVASAVSSWSAAYSSGDPNALRLALQDPKESRSYMPLSGARLLNGYVDKAIALWSENDSAERIEAGEPARVVVRAVFEIQWDGVTPEAVDSLPTVTYDLLVEKANTAAPVVVAWGGAGTGPSLKKYGNAITGRSIEAGPDDLGENTVGEDEALPGGAEVTP